MNSFQLLADDGAVLEDLRHLAEGVALQTGTELTQVRAQRCGVGRIEVDEDEALPRLGLHRDEAVRRLVEVEELLLLLDEGQRAVEGVAPRVVLARELAARATGLLAGIVLPHQLVTPVPADVVEGADRAWPSRTTTTDVWAAWISLVK